MPDPPSETPSETRAKSKRGPLAAFRRRLVVLLAAGLACIGVGVLAGLVYGSASSDLPTELETVSEAPPMPEAAPAVPVGPPPVEQRSFLSQLVPSPSGARRRARVPRRVDALARSLSLEDKAAQVLLVGFSGVDQTSPIFRQLAQRDFGGVTLEGRNFVDPFQLSGLTGAISATAQSAAHVPPFIVTAQEGGEFSELPSLPPAKAPGRVRSPREAAQSARRSARALKALGVNGVLAPVIDVGTEGGGKSGTRVFSDDPDLVADFASATIESYRAEGILAAPKHFPGLGAATQPAEAGPATVGLSVQELAQRDLRPFAAAVDAGVPALMVGHGLYPADDYVVPASLSRTISTGLLREQLRFRGLAITDDLSSPAIVGLSTSVPDATVEALKAGADLVWISGPRGDQERAYVAIVNAVRKGDLPRQRLDQAVRRVLVAKRETRLIR